ncbi:hypothetical protein [Streptosporangium saharense]|uniref:Uncharacterized protein n=1 Tax=Streptosporangium saharense TaxID=1706840 RepID=A0A7W7QN36_9ACTN|nr:hypothetical protein [Streptosporangium saharense]MBB4916627.1 hypothetical protein [Streptosporangium saharense]
MATRRMTPILVGIALAVAGPLVATTGAGAEPTPAPTTTTTTATASPRPGNDGQNAAEREFTGRRFADRKLSRKFAAYLRKRSGRPHSGGFTLSPRRRR